MTADDEKMLNRVRGKLAHNCHVAMRDARNMYSLCREQAEAIDEFRKLRRLAVQREMDATNWLAPLIAEREADGTPAWGGRSVWLHLKDKLSSQAETIRQLQNENSILRADIAAMQDVEVKP